jgi:hypothetical protein
MNPQELLERYVNSPSDQGDNYSEALSESVRNLVRRSIGKREVSDLDDFEEECVLAIWVKITALKSGESAGAIGNLEAFVRQAVHNRYCDAIRRKRPKWYNLKLELLEVFSGKSNAKGFALWHNPTSGGRMCGFAQWRDRTGNGPLRCRELLDDEDRFRGTYLGNRDPKELPVYELAAAVLDYCGVPVEVDTLTGCLAELVRARTEEPLSIDAQPTGDDDTAAPVDWLISADTGVEKQVVDASWFNHVIEWFWKEFDQLSLKQKKALLYGMSADQAMALCSEVGLKALAESLELPAEAFASLVGRLPLPDSATAEELGVPTRAVPSVRFKAWGRIRRRTRKSALTLDDS